MSSLAHRAFWVPILFIAGVSALVCAGLWYSDALTINHLVIAIIVLVVATPFFWVQSKRLVSPIGDLVPQAAGIAKGRLEVSNHGANAVPDELKSLAEAINEIAEKQGRDFAATQKLERVRSEFLGNVSHELRTPIFAVQGFLETLLDGAVDDPGVNRDFLERAHQQSARLNALLNDLIDISRIESGEMRMSFRLFDFQPYLRDLVAEMSAVAEIKDIQISFTGNILPDQEVEVYGDKERLKQVLVNLIDNAIKYTEKNGIVKVELLDMTPAEDMVTIRVRDTGIGIPAEHISRLFERFYRVDKDRSRSAPGGTGLGLAICKHIIEAHNSSIKVESTPGTGSVFSFSLMKTPQ